MTRFWLDIFRQAVAARGHARVAREIGVSPTTVSLVMSGKYGASTRNIEHKVINIYGDAGMVNCPVLGEIEPIRCADNFERAGKIGVRAGNPATIRLYRACRSCSLRNV